MTVESFHYKLSAFVFWFQVKAASKYVDVPVSLLLFAHALMRHEL